MIQFYSPFIREEHRLGPDESLHCVKVLRKKEGDEILVTDGEGTRYLCRIEKADSRGVLCSIITEERIEKNWDYCLTLAVAPTKNSERMSWLVEKATEIGVDRILFLQCRRSERKFINVERLRRNAVSAMNQSLKTILPEIKESITVGKLVELKGNKYFGYCEAFTDRKAFVKEIRVAEDVVVAIGPEGDFSEDEVVTMKEGGFQAVTFGDERLRTETAALFAVTAIHVVNQTIK